MNKFLVTLVFLLFITTACAAKTQKADLLGNDGLVITLPRLPTELFVGQGLEIPVTLENVGVHPVKNAVLVMTPYASDRVKFRSFPRIEGINLEGRSNLIPVGEKQSFIFSIASINLPGIREAAQPFQVLACYQYKTDATPVVCINPKLAFGTSDIAQGCTFTDAQISASQGAPIAVSKVESYYYLNDKEMEFRIYVKDVSKNGAVVNQVSYAKRCLGEEALTGDDLNKVNLQAYLSGEQIPCFAPTSTDSQNPVDSFVFRDGAYVVRCRAPLRTEDAAFTTPLSLYLSYGYVTGKEFSITLKNSALN